MELSDLEFANPMTTQHLERAHSYANPVQRSKAHPRIKTLKEWFLRNAMPDTEAEDVDISVEEIGGFKQLRFIEMGQRYKAFMMTSWEEVWNVSTQKQSTTSCLMQDIPFLFLICYAVFHRTTIRIMVALALYSLIIIAVGSVIWRSTVGIELELLSPFIVLVCMGTMVKLTKGTKDAKTIIVRRNELSLFTTQGRSDDLTRNTPVCNADELSECPSLLNITGRALKLMRRYLYDICISGRPINNVTKQDYVWERKYKKNGIVQVDSYLELAENVSSYLKSVYSMDAEKVLGPAFRPRVYSAYFMLFGVIFSTLYVLYYVGSSWAQYLILCPAFSASDSDDDEIRRFGTQ